jgi:DHA2 family multidrug resistance protein-like MFS transporter
MSRVSTQAMANTRGTAHQTFNWPLRHISGSRTSQTAIETEIPSAQPTDEAMSGLPEPRRTVAIMAVLLAMALVVLDASIVNVALPTMAESLRTTPALSVGIVTAYQVALVIGLLPCAALGESRGYRPVFTAGIALFIAASVACALSPSLGWLIAARFIQGLGGAAIMALGIALMRFAVGHKQFGAAIGWNALTVALSSAAGPSIGAAILSAANWPWLFAANLPVGAAALLATCALPYVAGTARKPDPLSIALNGLAFAPLVVGAELLPTSLVSAAALFIVAAMSLAALVRREAPKEAPLIPLDLLRAPPFQIAVIASISCFIGQTAAIVSLPFYLQHGFGLSPMMTGLYMTPWPLTVVIVAPIAGRLANRISTAWLCAAGGALLAIGLAAASLWPLQRVPEPILLMTALCGLGFGLFNVPNNRNMFLSAPSKRSGSAGGLQGTARLVGQTFGAVMMTLLFTMASADAAPRLGLAIGAGLAFVAGLVSILRIGPTPPTTAGV